MVQEERLAFMLCEADGEEGLTWTEVEDCEVEKSLILKMEWKWFRLIILYAKVRFNEDECGKKKRCK